MVSGGQDTKGWRMVMTPEGPAHVTSTNISQRGCRVDPTLPPASSLPTPASASPCSTRPISRCHSPSWSFKPRHGSIPSDSPCSLPVQLRLGDRRTPQRQETSVALEVMDATTASRPWGRLECAHCMSKGWRHRSMRSPHGKRLETHGEYGLTRDYNLQLCFRSPLPSPPGQVPPHLGAP